jgi:hypothetical protein
MWKRVLLLMGVAALVWAQAGVYTNARNLVSRVQADLRHASDQADNKSDKESERYDNAQRHLSDFDRELSRGKFDKGKLDTAIDDVKNVVEHNTLSPGSRDALGADLRDLRAVRATRGAS